MKTLSGLVLATLLTIGGAAAANESIDVVVVTAKQPASTMLSDMTEEIVAETSQALRDSQPAIAAPKVTVDVPSTQHDQG